MPKTYADLRNPIYKGHITMPNPASSGTGFLTVSAILQLMGEEAGWDYLDALNENIAIYTHSGSKPAKMAGEGEFPIGISFAYRGIKQKAAGEPVTTVFPAEGSGWDVEANALVRKPRMKADAKKFLDWAIGDESMGLYAAYYPVTSVKTGARAPEGYPEDPEGQMIDNDLLWSAENRARIIGEWTKRFEGGHLTR